jgi:hypothetical protein
MKRTTVGRARRVDPPGVPRVADIAGADYVSAFEIRGIGVDARSPEEWARSVFEDAPMMARRFLILGWTMVLRLRLGPRNSSANVLGWAIVADTTQTLTLQARSPLVTAHKVLDVRGDQLTVTTAVRYERKRARLIWSAIAPVHHRVEPWLITRAGRRWSPRSG